MANVTEKCVVTSYQLTLNLEEAQVLLAILQLIGGDSTRYPRAVCDTISEALQEAGVEAPKLQTEPGRSCIYFVS